MGMSTSTIASRSGRSSSAMDNPAVVHAVAESFATLGTTIFGTPNELEIQYAEKLMSDGAHRRKGASDEQRVRGDVPGFATRPRCNQQACHCALRRALPRLALRGCAQQHPAGGRLWRSRTARRL